MPSRPRNTLAVRIAEALRREISGALLTGGQLMPTERELCARFAASRETVRRSLRLLLADGHLVRVPGKGMQVRPPEVAAPAGNGGHQIAVLTSFPYQNLNYYYRQILSGLAAGSQKYGVPLSFVRREPGVSLAEFCSAGPVVLWPGVPGDQERLYEWQQTGRRFIVLSASYDDPDLPCVDCDNAMGVNLALDHLQARGHRAIGIVGRSRTPSVDHATRIGAAKALLAAKGLKSGPGMVFLPKEGWECPANDTAFAGWLEQQQITAVFSLDLELAGILYNLCRRQAIAIPERLSIVAFDDSELAEAFVPPLTTVAQPLETMGFRAIERLAEPAESTRVVNPTELFPTALRCRASVRALPGTG